MNNQEPNLIKRLMYVLIVNILRNKNTDKNHALSAKEIGNLIIEYMGLCEDGEDISKTVKRRLNDLMVGGGLGEILHKFFRGRVCMVAGKPNKYYFERII